MKHRTVKFLPFCFMALVAGMFMLATPARAADTPAAGTDVCTDFKGAAATMNNANGGPTTGILSDIYKFIKDVVGTATEKLFKAFTSSANYKAAVGAALVLMIVFFGVGFTIGVVQVSFGQILTRLVRIAVVGALISPSGWTFFSQYVVAFFADGTDDLIKSVMAIGTGMSNPPANATPFWQLDNIVSFVLQPQTLIEIFGAMFSGGPYAFMMTGLMILAMWSFVKMIVGALQTYAIAYVARSLILGVAPIFFVFLLFERTRTLFNSWINALVNLSLRPILLFTFLSFFLVMIQSAATDMLGSELCWSNFSSTVSGTTNKPSFWRFKDKDTNDLMTSQQTWEGPVECLFTGHGPNNAPCKSFPINVLDILSFLILVYLAQRFTGVIDQICSELSNAMVSLEGGSGLNSYLQSQNNSLASSFSGGQTNRNAGGATRPPGAG